MVKIHFNGPVRVNGPLVVGGRQDIVVETKKDEDEKDTPRDDDTDTDTDTETGRGTKIAGIVVIGGQRIVH